MFFFARKPAAIPTPDEALPGRSDPIPTAATHFLTDRPLKGPDPDGARIAFESDRGGGQQIYVMSTAGGEDTAQRISYGDGRYSTPVWSPRGDLIAFTRSVRGQFQVGVMGADGGGERILDATFHSEGPTWAPNGRVLAFFRESPGQRGASSLWSVDITGASLRRLPTPNAASDPAWSPLLP